MRPTTTLNLLYTHMTTTRIRPTRILLYYYCTYIRRWFLIRRLSVLCFRMMILPTSSPQSVQQSGPAVRVQRRDDQTPAPHSTVLVRSRRRCGRGATHFDHRSAAAATQQVPRPRPQPRQRCRHVQRRDGRHDLRVHHHTGVRRAAAHFGDPPYVV